MSDDRHIPILKDLIFRGRLIEQAEQNNFPVDADGDLEIEQEEDKPILDGEEVRRVLLKHMDNAYAEIMQLLEQKNED